MFLDLASGLERKSHEESLLSARPKEEEENCSAMCTNLPTNVDPDRAFRKFGASKSIDRQILCSSKESIHGFIEKCPVGIT